MLSQMLVAVFLLSLWFAPALAAAETTISAQRPHQTVEQHNLPSPPDVASGEIVIRSPAALREVELSIHQRGYWEGKFHQGDAAREIVSTHMVNGEFQPGGPVPFTYRESTPVPARSD